jgi:hypothetical protein
LLKLFFVQGLGEVVSLGGKGIADGWRERILNKNIECTSNAAQSSRFKQGERVAMKNSGVIMVNICSEEMWRWENLE